MKYKIQIEPEAQQDIQDAVRWYNSQQKGLGRRFYDELKEFIAALKHNPLYQIRYDNVRCLPIKKFPYTLHFTINETEKLVVIRAVFHTSRHPNIPKKRT
jgi:toxin ParE1/3/4